MSNHETLVEQFEIYLAENAKLSEKGIKASAARARAALQNISNALKS